MSDPVQVQVASPVSPAATHSQISVAHFGMILGMSGLGYAMLNASKLWGLPRTVGDAQLALTFVVWCALVLKYLVRLVHHRERLIEEFRDPISGSIASLIGVSTLIFVPAALPYSFVGAGILAVVGITWHIVFSAWHATTLWQGSRSSKDTTPALYLPDVAGNFTSAAALGVLGLTDWAWLFLGAGLFSWLSIEPVIKGSIIHNDTLRASRRPLMGIQAAPAVVCAASLLYIEPNISAPWVMLLLGYGLYQLMHGLRLVPWLKEQSFTKSYWSYTFGMTSGLNCCLKLALSGNDAARVIAVPYMIAATGFIVYLFAKTIVPK